MKRDNEYKKEDGQLNRLKYGNPFSYLLLARKVMLSTIVTMLLGSTVLSMFGCASDDTKAGATSAPVSGQSSAAQTGTAGSVPPTAEQEAAKQQGMQQGAAINAANEASQK